MRSFFCNEKAPFFVEKRVLISLEKPGHGTLVSKFLALNTLLYTAECQRGFFFHESTGKYFIV